MLPILLFVLSSYLAQVSCTTLLKAVSVFQPHESDYHKYSAIMAATEPLRIQCDEDIRKKVNPIVLLFNTLKGTSVKDPSSSVRIENADVDHICLKYEQKVEEIVKAYGMEIAAFNKLSNQIAKQASLKQKVVLQAYYYRIASDLEANTRRVMPILPTISDSNKERQKNLLKMPQVMTQMRSSASGSEKDEKKVNTAADIYSAFAKPDPNDSKFDSFCKVLKNVELVRMRMRDHLKATLGVHQLPECMCDPDVQPAMCPTIRNACSTFPHSAEAIIKHHGLDTTEFNALQQKLQSDFFFRVRVQMTVNKIVKENRNPPPASASS